MANYGIMSAVNKKLYIIGAFAAALLTAPGCMWSRVKVNDPDIVARSYSIRVGETSESQLESILMAKPTMRVPGKDSVMLGYSFSDTKHNALTLVVVNFSRSTTVAETLYVEIDPATKKVIRVHRPHVPTIEWRFWPFSDK